MEWDNEEKFSIMRMLGMDKVLEKLPLVLDAFPHYIIGVTGEFLTKNFFNPEHLTIALFFAVLFFAAYMAKKEGKA